MHSPTSEQPGREIPSAPSIASPSSGWRSLSMGFLLLLGALLCQSVTLVSGDYTAVLRAALILMAAADVLFIRACLRGNTLARGLSILFLLPTLLFVAEFLRRYFLP